MSYRALCMKYSRYINLQNHCILTRAVESESTDLGLKESELDNQKIEESVDLGADSTALMLTYVNFLSLQALFYS